MENIYNRAPEPDYGVSSVSPEIREIDRELEELLKKQTAKIKVVGCGGGGGNSLSRMREIGIKGGELIAINTDAQDLLYANADQKILIGKELTQGLGAGSNPRVGEEAAKESEMEIKKKISGRIVFTAPYILTRSGRKSCDIEDITKKTGLKLVEGPFPEYREKQVVGREIFVLGK